MKKYKIKIEEDDFGNTDVTFSKRILGFIYIPLMWSHSRRGHDGHTDEIEHWLLKHGDNNVKIIDKRTIDNGNITEGGYGI